MAVRDGKIEPTAKTDGSLRNVWLSQRALEAVAAMPWPMAGGLVFTAPDGGMVNLSNFRKRVWKEAFTDAGVPYRAIDNTRHTFASLRLAADAPIEWISKQLGHKNSDDAHAYARWLPSADERIHALVDSQELKNLPEIDQSKSGDA